MYGLRRCIIISHSKRSRKVDIQIAYFLIIKFKFMAEPRIMTEEELEKQIAYFKRNAKPFDRKFRRSRKRSSLHDFVKTKEQADDFMARLNAHRSTKPGTV